MFQNANITDTCHGLGGCNQAHDGDTKGDFNPILKQENV